MKARKTGPTIEQLRVLVDRAERGRLTAAEAALLRIGLNALDAARRSSGGAQVAVKAARAAGERVVRERDAAVRLYADVYGMTVAQAELDVRAAVRTDTPDRNSPEKAPERPPAARTASARPVPASRL